uniref:CG8152_0 protein n=1 Tax=Fopius arisanus TaxID=64838 RepID=A0A0C9R4M1_9HYME
MRSFKVFVRQSEKHPDGIVNKHKGELNFRGEEARKIYEDIVTETSSNNPQAIPRKSHCLITKKTGKPKDKNRLNITANVILKSIEQNDWHFIEQNVTKDNVNSTDDYGWTPLMLAAYNGNYRIVEYLLISGADKYLKEKSGLTALELARKKNHQGVISLLTCDELKIARRAKVPDKEERLSEFYCSICKLNFRETTMRRHESSMLHIFNTNPKLPDPVYGIPKGNKGYQIMLNAGWKESKGLGPSGSGLKYPVKTILKRDRKGLGGEDKSRPRVTHFQSNDVNAIRHVRQERVMKGKSWRKNREEFLTREARRDRALRQALS